MGLFRPDEMLLCVEAESCSVKVTDRAAWSSAAGGDRDEESARKFKERGGGMTMM